MRIEGINGKERPTGWEAYENYKLALQNRQGGSPEGLAAEGTGESTDTKAVNNAAGCDTCKNRKYQDGSDDPGVSFKTPTRLSPDQAASAVRSHEMEHVGREQSKAQREDRQVVSQFVTYRNAICAECGRTYISGGTTTTTTRGRAAYEKPQEGEPARFEGYA